MRVIVAMFCLALLSPSWLACGVEPDLDPADEPRGALERRPISWGKPDGTGCSGSCGGRSPAGCWCDLACASHGDCCPDKQAVCDGVAPSCAGSCGGKASAGCWCDAACASYGDCCPDRQQVCDAVAPPPTPTPTPTPPTCPGWACTGSGCTSLVPMPGASDPTSGQAQQAGYYVGTAAKYAFVRQDLARLLTWAACQVRARFPGTAPLSLNDISQSDGKTPGVDVGQPRHPTTTHVGGRDIDVAYYQTDGSNNAQIICGDGSDTNYNGQPGTYNDGYFCTTTNNIVDWDRQVWFLAQLFEYDKARVFGIDQTLVQALGARLKQFYDEGEISKTIYDRFNQRVAWGQAGGWSFHHHHIHLSFQ